MILSAIRPSQLLAGKVIGVGLLGLLQITLIGAIGLLVALFGGDVSLPSSTPETAALVLVYFVLGYAFYGCAFAGAAALVSRQEDSQSTTTPLLVILIGGYLATNSALGNPNGTRPSAPSCRRWRRCWSGAGRAGCPCRLGTGGVPGADGALDPLVVRVAGRIYDRSVLRFGSPMKLREALALSRHG